VSGTFITGLRKELAGRLSDLDSERTRIAAALAALGAEHGGDVAEPGNQSLEDLVLSRLRARPGTRASMLGLELRCDVSVIFGLLESLESAGRVERTGLGWAANDH
jgi:hypothetical protein